MICDWLANWECLFPRESSIKTGVFGLDKRRNLMSIPKTRTKASPTKAFLSEKLSKIERPHLSVP